MTYRSPRNPSPPSPRQVLRHVVDYRGWLCSFPDLFGTDLQHDCFLRIATMTMDADTISPLKELYRGLPYAENAMRAYLRRLHLAGWVEWTVSGNGDRRAAGLRITPRFKDLRDAYLARFSIVAEGREAPGAKAAAGAEGAGLALAQPRYRA